MHSQKRLIPTLILIALTMSSCYKNKETPPHISIDVINKMTPIKDQKNNDLCWVYAMLATIETEHIMMGDSVNLSIAYIARNILSSQIKRYYLSQGKDSLSLRGISPQLLYLLEEYGAMPYETYHSNCNFNVVKRKLLLLAKSEIEKLSGLNSLSKKTEDLLDDLINPLPLAVYMYGVKYTPKEFAHSVCLKNEYITMTSFSDKPFYENIVLEVADNTMNIEMLNLPLDTLVNRVRNLIKSGHAVCWEGDISEKGFSFEKGIATLGNKKNKITQEIRQKEFERFYTTDDHAMELVGIAHDETGKRYFICKNSWGTNNPFNGLMYMEEDYFKLKTICVVAPNIF